MPWAIRLWKMRPLHLPCILHYLCLLPICVFRGWLLNDSLLKTWFRILSQHRTSPIFFFNFQSISFALFQLLWVLPMHVFINCCIMCHFWEPDIQILSSYPNITVLRKTSFYYRPVHLLHCSVLLSVTNMCMYLFRLLLDVFSPRRICPQYKWLLQNILRWISLTLRSFVLLNNLCLLFKRFRFLGYGFMVLCMYIFSICWKSVTE